MIHINCGGVVVSDPDFIVGGEGQEGRWSYRCLKCQETFREAGEWLKDEGSEVIA